MTNEELHEILDNESRKITVNELSEIIYTLKNDCLDEFVKAEVASKEEHWYMGEMNGFQICLDLLEHLTECDNNA